MEAHSQNSEPSRVLCIQLKQLGDVILTSAAIRSLAQAFPGCEIDFLTQAPAHRIYEHSPYVKRVYRVRWQARELLPLLFRFWRRRYDAVIDFSGSSKTAVLCYATRIRRRIAREGHKKPWCFTELVPIPAERKYAALQNSALLSAFGIDTSDPSLDFFLPPDAGDSFRSIVESWGIGDGPLFAVSPVSKHEYKVWPLERYAEICDRLVAEYRAQICFLIGPGEKHFAEGVAQRMQHQSLPIDDSLSLYQAGALLDRSVAYIGNDSGLMHLSVARGRPTFSVFGRHSPSHWASPENRHLALEHDPGCKGRCHYPDCGIECLTEISVDRVWQELTRFLDQLPATGPRD